MKSKFAQLAIAVLGIAVIVISCRKNHVSQSNELVYKKIGTSENVLKSAGINQISYAIANADMLVAKYDNPATGLAYEVSMTDDTLSRTSEIRGTDGNDSFSMKIDSRNNTFAFKSSKGDDYFFDAKLSDNPNEPGLQLFDRRAGQPVKKDWYLSTKFDYKTALFAHTVLGELNKQKLFKSQLTLIKEREADMMLQEKAIQFTPKKSSQAKTMLEAPGGKCEVECKSEIYYNWWSTQACNEAYNTIASACSNSLCIGDCGVRSCDCFGGFGDFMVACRAFSKACGEKVVVIE